MNSPKPMPTFGGKGGPDPEPAPRQFQTVNVPMTVQQLQADLVRLTARVAELELEVAALYVETED